MLSNMFSLQVRRKRGVHVFLVFFVPQRGAFSAQTKNQLWRLLPFAGATCQ